MSEIIFDASSVTVFDVALTVFFTFLLSLFPFFIFMRTLKKGEVFPTGCLKWFFIFVAGVLFLVVVIMYGLMIRDLHNSFEAFKKCFPFVEYEYCEKKLSAVIEVSSRGHTSRLKTDNFDVSWGNSFVHYWHMNREHGELRFGDCIFTVHSAENFNHILYAEKRACKEKR